MAPPPEASPAGGLVRLAARIVWARARGVTTTGAMCVVVDDRGQVLLVKPRYRRWWGLPGGYGDPGEDPRDTAARETFEETGVVLTGAPTELARRRRGGHLDVLCTARAVDPSAATADASWEIGAVLWVDPADPTVRLHPVCLDVLALVPGGLAAAAGSAPR